MTWPEAFQAVGCTFGAAAIVWALAWAFVKKG